MVTRADPVPLLTALMVSQVHLTRRQNEPVPESQTMSHPLHARQHYAVYVCATPKAWASERSSMSPPGGAQLLLGEKAKRGGHTSYRVM